MPELYQFWPNLGQFLEFAGSLQTRLHSILQQARFAKLGPKSRLEYPSKLVSPHLIAIGDGVRISADVWLNAKDDRGDGNITLEIGNGTYIGRMAHINAWQYVKIGRDVLIADRGVISDVNHNFADITRPIQHRGDSFRGGVTIEDGSWIGVGAVILPGVTIGRNAVIGANAVLNRNVKAFTVVGGVHVKLIRELSEKDDQSV